ncbi:MAG: hypothetical protein GY741_16900 [Phycisphaeraceae bacterium]|nr:hypothetical protein [Phycisphaeraceae bacterium]
MPFLRARSFCSRSSLIAVPVLVSCTAATADLVNRWEVGSGDATAMIQFDFLSSGNTYVVDLFFDESMSGQAAIEMIAADSTTAGFSFEYDVISYSFGDFLVGIDIEGDSDYGDGSTPPYVDYWHYWTGDAGGPWTESMVGFGDRLLTDGSADAWVFGTADAPATIPAPATIAIVLPMIAARRRRRAD